MICKLVKTNQTNYKYFVYLPAIIDTLTKNCFRRKSGYFFVEMPIKDAPEDESYNFSSLFVGSSG